MRCDTAILCSSAGTTEHNRVVFDHGGSTAHGQSVYHACDRTDPECVPILQFLVDRGAPVNNTLWEDRPDLASWANVGATTPLHNAAAAGNLDSVRFLLEKRRRP